MKTVIFDIDGTLADCGARLRHLRKEPKDWNAFFDEIELDPPNEPVVEICRAMHQRGYRILLCTGRSEKLRGKTEEWLARHEIPYHEIRMRPDGDFRPDDEAKKKMVGEEEKKDVLFVVEDRSRMVRMWREMGLACLQCAEGDF